MDIKYSQDSKFVNILSNNVVNKLVGGDVSFERFETNSYPSQEIVIGSLNGLDDEDEEDLDSYSNKGLSTNSMSVKFLVKNLDDLISIVPSCSVFYKVYPNFKEETDYIDLTNQIGEDKYKLSRIWKREDIVFSKCDISLLNDEDRFDLDFTKVLNKIVDDDEFFTGHTRIDKNVMDSEESYLNKINSVRHNVKFDFKWNCEISVKSKDFIQDGEKYQLVEIFLINNSSNKNDYESTLFNAVLNISFNNNTIVPFKYSYSKDDNLKYQESYFRFINCNGDYDKKDNFLVTKGYAEFNQSEISPVNFIEGIDLSFKTLSSKEGLVELNKIYEKMEEHYNICKTNSTGDNEFEKSLVDFEYMKDRFKTNLDLLGSNEILQEAFFLMNETFELNSKNKEYNTWRLFQIVFIVSLINDIFDKSVNREQCELLHVMTGGGKSEAYFGIVIFTIFYDRLIGKCFGVSAITKFPLRMLSVQQLQRIANLFIFAEEIRLKENIKGEPFSIAYFVGSQEEEFPSYNFNIIKKIKKVQSKDSNIKGKIIDTCPICGGEVVLDVDEPKQLVIHKCVSCGKIFRLYFSDDEIYRMLPTFIVATVDKFAGIAKNRRFKNLFGGKLSECEEHGFIPRNDKCMFKTAPRKSCNNLGDPLECDFNTGPSLIIQDEMHLIKEGFGTIDSHFESLCEVLEEEFTGERVKHIVMTATVSGAKNQIEQLYNKNVRIFPPTLKDSDGNDFFFKENSSKMQRKIIGLKPSIPKSKILYYILRYISEFIKFVEEDITNFSSEHDFEVNELENILGFYKKFLTYHNKKNDAQNTNYYIEDFVNSKDCYRFDSRPLTGENSLDDIKEVISTVKNFYDDENKKKELCLINATSIVSHGVDIDDWNIMIFDGMPRSTSEYIQALSRVGRKKIGLLFLTFFNNRTRDLSFYQHFNEYHKILQDKVENVPLSRWAKLGFKQTFTSVFNASILNYLSNVLEKPIYNKEDFIKAFQDSDNINIIIDFINKAYMTDSGMLGSDYFKENIRFEVEKRIDYINNYSGSQINFFPNALEDSSLKYYKTQFGMRGIQDEIVLMPYKSDFNFRNLMRGD